MPRWEPDARERLVVAALQLFSEQGYDETTDAVIADRAGLTKSTFHPVAVVWHLSPGSGELFMAQLGLPLRPSADRGCRSGGV